MQDSEKATLIEWIVASTGVQRDIYEKWTDEEVEQYFLKIREESIHELGE